MTGRFVLIGRLIRRPALDVVLLEINLTVREEQATPSENDGQEET